MPDRYATAAEIEEAMRAVAIPDARFGCDFTRFIPGFPGADAAAALLAAEPAYRDARSIFVTPDNGLIPFRARALADGKTLVLPSYGLHRGFLVVEGGTVPPDDALYAAWLDGLDHFGREISLGELRARDRFDLVVTGASAITPAGQRFGMGHAYLDLEWGILDALDAVSQATPVAAIVHDLQFTDLLFEIADTDVLADLIATPTRLVRTVPRPRPSGLRWDLIDPDIAAAPAFADLPDILDRRFRAEMKS